MKKLFKDEENIIKEEQGEMLAEYDDVEFYLCAGGWLEGVYQIHSGVVDIIVDDEDGFDIVFIENIKNSKSTNNKKIAS